MKPIIEVKNLYKKYRAGEIKPYITLRESIVDLFKFPTRFGSGNLNENLGNRDFWALEGVSFTAKQGDLIGVIGPNGSGKSTLLKVLSRITYPTRGEITLRGRVASMLEVGTGFHYELTGRENIYLNGAILGMKRREINNKFDDIVSFSGTEKFIDSPVKHLSSGMYVRLAFSVAAFLDSDILLVDEVLAVGDIEFQNKCLKKMDSITKTGNRTILFVSHNLNNIKRLCNKTIYLRNGKIYNFGNTDKVIDSYFSSSIEHEDLKRAFDGNLAEDIIINSVKLNGSSKNISIVNPLSRLLFEVEGIAKKNINNFRFTFSVFSNENRLFSIHDRASYTKKLNEGKFKVGLEIPKNILRPGRYYLAFGGDTKGQGEYFWGTNLLSFIVSEVWSNKNERLNLGIINIDKYRTFREN